jgi:hypothetical protein
VQQLEILAGDGIFVAAAQEANVIGIFQVFEARRVTPGFLHIPLDRPRILRSPVDHFFLAIAPHPEGHGGSGHAGRNHHQGHEQHQHEQDVTALGGAERDGGVWPLVVGRWSSAVGSWPLAFHR